MAKTLEPTFGTVKVTPSHSPPVGTVKDSQPLSDLVKSVSASSECTGKGFFAVKHQSTSQLQTGTDRLRSSSSEYIRKDFSAKKHQSSSQLKTDRPHTN